MVYHFFIESKNNATPECVFLKKYINRVRPDLIYDVTPMNGIGNLFREPNKTMMRLHSDKREKNVVIVDADFPSNEGGFASRRKFITDTAKEEDLLFDFFLFPNNADDGIFENLLESIARKDKHNLFFGCYDDYEHCVKSQKDSNGNPVYQVPNLKGKLHTYINAVPMDKKYRKLLGGGDWQFENGDYWDLDNVYLNPLKTFLMSL